MIFFVKCEIVTRYNFNMEYKILVAERGYYAVVKYENMTIKTSIEHRRKIATLSAATIKTNSSTLINPVESFIKFLPSMVIQWDTTDGDYLCYQADSLLIWVILEDQNEKYYRDAYKEQKQNAESYKIVADKLMASKKECERTTADQLKKVIVLQDKLDASAGALLTSKKEYERIIAEFNSQKKVIERLSTELNELREDLKIYIDNELIYQKNIDTQKRKIEKLKKLLDD
jgi:hypothetical protein